MVNKIGVFVCKCGGNISDVVDVDKVAAALENENAELIEIQTYLCSEPAIDRMKEVVKEKGLNKLVLACCTPKMHKKKFQRALKEVGLNPALVEIVNVREHCSWVHEDDPEGATIKATDLVRGRIKRVEKSVPLEAREIDVIPKILVMGGGIAGIIASLRVAESVDCYLVEKEPSIGGHMIQYPKVFPTLDCSQCILTPKLGDVHDAENIHLFTLSEIESISGNTGNWEVKIRQKPRYVDVEKCTGCGDCFSACPVEVPSEFDQGLGTRKAIYRPFLQAVPNAAVIDALACTDCGLCETVCPANAIIRDEDEKIIELDVGSIIVATGFDLYDPSVLGRYLFKKNPNVLTSLQMERMLDITGPTNSQVIRPKDGKGVKKVAFILCCGSRNNEAGANKDEGVPYCSTVCCLYALKQATLLRKFDIDVWIHYIDIRAPGTKYEDFYHHTQELGVNFIKGKVSEIMPTPDGERLLVCAEDMLINRMIENEVDLVILCPPILPSEGTEDLAKKLKVPLNEYKFILESHPKLDPLATKREGIFAAGMVTGPKDIQTTVSEAEGAAMKAVNFVSQKKEIEPNKAYVIPELCTGCRECIEICPEEAITVEGDENILINDLACTGCGLCVPMCPENAIDMQSYSEEQLLAQIKGTLVGSKAELKILVFVEKELVYTAADIAGVSRLTYPSSTRFITLPSNARLKLSYIFYAFANGADGIMFLEAPEEEGPVPEAHKAAEKIIEDYQEVLEDDYDLDSSRLWFSRIFVPDWRKLATVFDSFHQMIEDLGPLTDEERGELMQAWSKGKKLSQVQ